MKEQTPSITGHFHAVRFYEDEHALYRIVADFIGDGLVAGEPVIVIATPSHCEQITRELLAMPGAQPLRSSADWVMLDAEKTLDSFMRNGVPDPVLFEQSIGGVLDLARAGRPDATVRAYGEMVDCLWKAGQAEAAIRLEVLWNRLATTRQFSLLCGYSMGNFYKHGAYEDICGQHTHVLSGTGQPTRIGIA